MKALMVCLDGMDLDLDLAHIHLGFQGSKCMDLKFPHKPKNLEIPCPYAHALFSILHRLQKSVTLSLPRLSFSSFSLSRSKVCLSQLFSSSLSFLFFSFYWILIIKALGFFVGFIFFFCEFIWVSFDLCVDASMNCRYI